jgi:hypothetical protein
MKDMYKVTSHVIKKIYASNYHWLNHSGHAKLDYKLKSINCYTSVIFHLFQQMLLTLMRKFMECGTVQQYYDTMNSCLSRGSWQFQEN